MLKSEFGSDLDITSQGTRDVTGFFEVELIKDNGEKILLHSKKNGEGFVDNEKKFQKIVDGIKNYL